MWKPTVEDIQRVVAEQNPWHELGDVPDALAPATERALARLLWEHVEREEPRRYQLVLGPRRVGKTTVMYQTVRHLIRANVAPKRLWWFRLDHPLLLVPHLGELVQLAVELGKGSSERPTYVFLDELVYAKEWDLWLKTFYDERYPIRVVATSSATGALRDRRLESGVGRWEEQFLMPYLFTEFLDLVGHEARAELGPTLLDSIERAIEESPDLGDVERWRQAFVLMGGFPELLVRARLGQEDDPISRLLESQQILRTDAIERAVYKDIPQSFGVDNPMALERLLYTLAGDAGGLVSPRRICSELSISQPTFDRYVSYLERAFIIFMLPNFSGREASVQKRGRKLYFADGAVRNAALQRGVGPLSNPAELGLLLENQIASHLHALSLQSQTRLFHWRDGKHEVDFVFDHPKRPAAFEVASSPDHPRSGLVALRERYPRFKESCYLVAPGIHLISPSMGRAGVGTISAETFLVIVGRQAEQALGERLGRVS